TAIVKSNPRKYPTSVTEGGKTEFDVVEEVKRKETANVSGPGGSNVQGSKDSADRSSSRTSGWYLWYRENGKGGRRQYPEDRGEVQPQRYHQSTDTMAAQPSTDIMVTETDGKVHGDEENLIELVMDVEKEETTMTSDAKN
uniref:Uncharacterized protein n=1 Tax=Biomphalaria glabrata TaxID=6526 RepID=A0A2C9L5B5_BIOGL